jgi:hypothetical protein
VKAVPPATIEELPQSARTLTGAGFCFEVTMPYSIRKNGNKFEVVKDDDGKIMGEHPDREQARRQLAALYANESGKGLNLSYVKSIGLDLSPDVLAVKTIGTDTIRGYVALWGSPDRVDLDREFFTKDTDFWDSVIQGQRPLTYDHANDDATKSNPIIGRITEMGQDAVGRWYTAQLEKSHQYRKAIDKLIEMGALGTSSDSAPQYVLREKQGKGVWLKRWPLFAAALTVTPCEPRQVSTVDYFKSAGITLPDAPGVSCPDQAWQGVQRLSFLRSFYIQ